MPNFSTSCQREELKVDLESLNKVMIRWGDEMLTENIATQIKIPKIKKNHKTFEDLIGLKRRENDGWQNLKGKHCSYEGIWKR